MQQEDNNVFETSLDSGISDDIASPSADEKPENKMKTFQEILFLLERDRLLRAEQRKRLSQLSERRHRRKRTEDPCNVCCHSLDIDNIKSSTKCVTCQKSVCRGRQCAIWIPSRGGWECQLCNQSQESIAKSSEWLHQQITGKYLSPLSARSEPALARAGLSPAPEIDRRSSVASSFYGDQKEKVREIIEETLAEMLGGQLDNVSVNQLSRNRAYLPTWENGEEPGLSHTKLKRFIEKIINDTLRLPNFTNEPLTPDPKYDQNLPFFDPKKYQELLATAVLNKIVDSYNYEQKFDRNKDAATDCSDLDRNHNALLSGRKVQSGSISSSSIEPESDCSVTDPPRSISQCRDFSRSDSDSNLLHGIVNDDDDRQDSTMLTKYLAKHNVPLPDFSIASDSSHDDDDILSDSRTYEKIWEENWLFKKKRSSHESMGSVGMLVPCPRVDVKTQIGDRTADELSDLSEAGSDCENNNIDEIEDVPQNALIQNRNIIGGKSPIGIFDELLEQTSMISTSSLPEGCSPYTETKNDFVLGDDLKHDLVKPNGHCRTDEAINSFVDTQTLQNQFTKSRDKKPAVKANDSTGTSESKKSTLQRRPVYVSTKDIPESELTSSSTASSADNAPRKTLVHTKPRRKPTNTSTNHTNKIAAAEEPSPAAPTLSEKILKRIQCTKASAIQFLVVVSMAPSLASSPTVDAETFNRIVQVANTSPSSSGQGSSPTTEEPSQGGEEMKAAKSEANTPNIETIPLPEDECAEDVGLDVFIPPPMEFCSEAEGETVTFPEAAESVSADQLTIPDEPKMPTSVTEASEGKQKDLDISGSVSSESTIIPEVSTSLSDSEEILKATSSSAKLVETEVTASDNSEMVCCQNEINDSPSNEPEGLSEFSSQSSDSPNNSVNAEIIKPLQTLVEAAMKPVSTEAATVEASTENNETKSESRQSEGCRELSVPTTDIKDPVEVISSEAAESAVEPEVISVEPLSSLTSDNKSAIVPGKSEKSETTEMTSNEPSIVDSSVSTPADTVVVHVAKTEVENLTEKVASTAPSIGTHVNEIDQMNTASENMPAELLTAEMNTTTKPSQVSDVKEVSLVTAPTLSTEAIIADPAENTSEVTSECAQMQTSAVETTVENTSAEIVAAEVASALVALISTRDGTEITTDDEVSSESLAKLTECESDVIEIESPENYQISSTENKVKINSLEKVEPSSSIDGISACSENTNLENAAEDNEPKTNADACPANMHLESPAEDNEPNINADETPVTTTSEVPPTTSAVTEATEVSTISSENPISSNILSEAVTLISEQPTNICVDCPSATESAAHDEITTSDEKQAISEVSSEAPSPQNVASDGVEAEVIEPITAVRSVIEPESTEPVSLEISIQHLQPTHSEPTESEYSSDSLAYESAYSDVDPEDIRMASPILPAAVCETLGLGAEISSGENISEGSAKSGAAGISESQTIVDSEKAESVAVEATMQLAVNSSETAATECTEVTVSDETAKSVSAESALSIEAVEQAVSNVESRAVAADNEASTNSNAEGSTEAKPKLETLPDPEVAPINTSVIPAEIVPLITKSANELPDGCSFVNEIEQSEVTSGKTEEHQKMSESHKDPTQEESLKPVEVESTLGESSSETGAPTSVEAVSAVAEPTKTVNAETPGSLVDQTNSEVDAQITPVSPVASGADAALAENKQPTSVSTKESSQGTDVSIKDSEMPANAPELIPKGEFEIQVPTVSSTGAPESGIDAEEPKSPEEKIESTEVEPTQHDNQPEVVSVVEEAHLSSAEEKIVVADVQTDLNTPGDTELETSQSKSTEDLAADQKSTEADLPKIESLSTADEPLSTAEEKPTTVNEPKGSNESELNQTTGEISAAPESSELISGAPLKEEDKTEDPPEIVPTITPEAPKTSPESNNFEGKQGSTDAPNTEKSIDVEVPRSSSPIPAILIQKASIDETVTGETVSNDEASTSTVDKPSETQGNVAGPLSEQKGTEVESPSVESKVEAESPPPEEPASTNEKLLEASQVATISDSLCDQPIVEGDSSPQAAEMSSTDTTSEAPHEETQNTATAGPASDQSKFETEISSQAQPAPGDAVIIDNETPASVNEKSSESLAHLEIETPSDLNEKTPEQNSTEKSTNDYPPLVEAVPESPTDDDSSSASEENVIPSPEILVADSSSGSTEQTSAPNVAAEAVATAAQDETLAAQIPLLDDISGCTQIAASEPIEPVDIDLASLPPPPKFLCEDSLSVSATNLSVEEEVAEPVEIFESPTKNSENPQDACSTALEGKEENTNEPVPCETVAEENIKESTSVPEISINDSVAADADSNSTVIDAESSAPESAVTEISESFPQSEIKVKQEVSIVESSISPETVNTDEQFAEIAPEQAEVTEFVSESTEGVSADDHEPEKQSSGSSLTSAVIFEDPLNTQQKEAGQPVPAAGLENYAVITPTSEDPIASLSPVEEDTHTKQPSAPAVSLPELVKTENSPSALTEKVSAKEVSQSQVPADIPSQKSTISTDLQVNNEETSTSLEDKIDPPDAPKVNAVLTPSNSKSPLPEISGEQLTENETVAETLPPERVSVESVSSRPAEDLDSVVSKPDDSDVTPKVEPAAEDLDPVACKPSDTDGTPMSEPATDSSEESPASVLSSATSVPETTTNASKDQEPESVTETCQLAEPHVGIEYEMTANTNDVQSNSETNSQTPSSENEIVRAENEPDRKPNESEATAADPIVTESVPAEINDPKAETIATTDSTDKLVISVPATLTPSGDVPEPTSAELVPPADNAPDAPAPEIIEVEPIVAVEADQSALNTTKAEPKATDEAEPQKFLSSEFTISEPTIQESDTTQHISTRQPPEQTLDPVVESSDHTVPETSTTEESLESIVTTNAAPLQTTDVSTTPKDSAPIEELPIEPHQSISVASVEEPTALPAVEENSPDQQLQDSNVNETESPASKANLTSSATEIQSTADSSTEQVVPHEAQSEPSQSPLKPTDQTVPAAATLESVSLVSQALKSLESRKPDGDQASSKSPTETSEQVVPDVATTIQSEDTSLDVQITSEPTMAKNDDCPDVARPIELSSAPDQTVPETESLPESIDEETKPISTSEVSEIPCEVEVVSDSPKVEAVPQATSFVEQATPEISEAGKKEPSVDLVSDEVDLGPVIPVDAKVDDESNSSGKAPVTENNGSNVAPTKDNVDTPTREELNVTEQILPACAAAIYETTENVDPPTKPVVSEESATSLIEEANQPASDLGTIESQRVSSVALVNTSDISQSELDEKINELPTTVDATAIEEVPIVAESSTPGAAEHTQIGDRVTVDPVTETMTETSTVLSSDVVQEGGAPTSSDPSIVELVEKSQNTAPSHKVEAGEPSIKSKPTVAIELPTNSAPAATEIIESSTATVSETSSAEPETSDVNPKADSLAILHSCNSEPANPKTEPPVSAVPEDTTAESKEPVASELSIADNDSQNAEASAPSLDDSKSDTTTSTPGTTTDDVDSSVNSEACNSATNPPTVPDDPTSEIAKSIQNFDEPVAETCEATHAEDKVETSKIETDLSPTSVEVLSAESVIVVTVQANEGNREDTVSQPPTPDTIQLIPETQMPSTPETCVTDSIQSAPAPKSEEVSDATEIPPASTSEPDTKETIVSDPPSDGQESENLVPEIVAVLSETESAESSEAVLVEPADNLGPLDDTIVEIVAPPCGFGDFDPRISAADVVIPLAEADTNDSQQSEADAPEKSVPLEASSDAVDKIAPTITESPEEESDCGKPEIHPAENTEKSIAPSDANALQESSADIAPPATESCNVESYLITDTLETPIVLPDSITSEQQSQNILEESSLPHVAETLEENVQHTDREIEATLIPASPEIAAVEIIKAELPSSSSSKNVPELPSSIAECAATNDLKEIPISNKNPLSTETCSTIDLPDNIEKTCTETCDPVIHPEEPSENSISAQLPGNEVPTSESADLKISEEPSTDTLSAREAAESLSSDDPPPPDILSDPASASSIVESPGSAVEIETQPVNVTESTKQNAAEQPPTVETENTDITEADTANLTQTPSECTPNPELAPSETTIPSGTESAPPINKVIDESFKQQPADGPDSATKRIKCEASQQPSPSKTALASPDNQSVTTETTEVAPKSPDEILLDDTTPQPETKPEQSNSNESTNASTETSKPDSATAAATVETSAVRLELELSVTSEKTGTESHVPAENVTDNAPDEPSIVPDNSTPDSSNLLVSVELQGRDDSETKTSTEIPPTASEAAETTTVEPDSMTENDKVTTEESSSVAKNAKIKTPEAQPPTEDPQIEETPDTVRQEPPALPETTNPTATDQSPSEELHAAEAVPLLQATTNDTLKNATADQSPSVEPEIKEDAPQSPHDDVLSPQVVAPDESSPQPSEPSSAVEPTDVTSEPKVESEVSPPDASEQTPSNETQQIPEILPTSNLPTSEAEKNLTSEQESDGTESVPKTPILAEKSKDEPQTTETVEIPATDTLVTSSTEASLSSELPTIDSTAAALSSVSAVNEQIHQSPSSDEIVKTEIFEPPAGVEETNASTTTECETAPSGSSDESTLIVKTEEADSLLEVSKPTSAEIFTEETAAADVSHCEQNFPEISAEPAHTIEAHDLEPLPTADASEASTADPPYSEAFESSDPEPVAEAPTELSNEAASETGVTVAENSADSPSLKQPKAELQVPSEPVDEIEPQGGAEVTCVQCSSDIVSSSKSENVEIAEVIIVSSTEAPTVELLKETSAEDAEQISTPLQETQATEFETLQESKDPVDVEVNSSEQIAEDQSSLSINDSSKVSQMPNSPETIKEVLSTFTETIAKTDSSIERPVPETPDVQSNEQDRANTVERTDQNLDTLTEQMVSTQDQETQPAEPTGEPNDIDDSEMSAIELLAEPASNPPARRQSITVASRASSPIAESLLAATNLLLLPSLGTFSGRFNEGLKANESSEELHSERTSAESLLNCLENTVNRATSPFLMPSFDDAKLERCDSCVECEESETPSLTATKNDSEATKSILEILIDAAAKALNAKQEDIMEASTESQNCAAESSVDTENNRIGSSETQASVLPDLSVSADPVEKSCSQSVISEVPSFAESTSATTNDCETLSSKADNSSSQTNQTTRPVSTVAKESTETPSTTSDNSEKESKEELPEHPALPKCPANLCDQATVESCTVLEGPVDKTDCLNATEDEVQSAADQKPAMTKKMSAQPTRPSDLPLATPIYSTDNAANASIQISLENGICKPNSAKTESTESKNASTEGSSDDSSDDNPKILVTTSSVESVETPATKPREFITVWQFILESTDSDDEEPLVKQYDSFSEEPAQSPIEPADGTPNEKSSNKTYVSSSEDISSYETAPSSLSNVAGESPPLSLTDVPCIAPPITFGIGFGETRFDSDPVEQTADDIQIFSMENTDTLKVKTTDSTPSTPDSKFEVAEEALDALYTPTPERSPTPSADEDESMEITQEEGQVYITSTSTPRAVSEPWSVQRGESLDSWATADSSDFEPEPELSITPPEIVLCYMTPTVLESIPEDLELSESIPMALDALEKVLESHGGGSLDDESVDSLDTMVGDSVSDIDDFDTGPEEPVVDYDSETDATDTTQQELIAHSNVSDSIEPTSDCTTDSQSPTVEFSTLSTDKLTSTESSSTTTTTTTTDDTVCSAIESLSRRIYIEPSAELHKDSSPPASPVKKVHSVTLSIELTNEPTNTTTTSYSSDDVQPVTQDEADTSEAPATALPQPPALTVTTTTSTSLDKQNKDKNHTKLETLKHAAFSQPLTADEDDTHEVGHLSNLLPGSIAEREHKKWYNAVDMPNNPYSKEALSRRLSNMSDRPVDIPNINSPLEKAKSEDRLSGGEDVDAVIAEPVKVDYRRYGRDYYINDTTEPVNKKLTTSLSLHGLNTNSRDENPSDKELTASPPRLHQTLSSSLSSLQRSNSWSDKRSTFTTAAAGGAGGSGGSSCDIFTARPVRVEESDPILSKATKLEYLSTPDRDFYLLPTEEISSLRSISASEYSLSQAGDSLTPSEDSDTIRVYDLKTQQTRLIRDDESIAAGTPVKELNNTNTLKLTTSSSSVSHHPTIVGATSRNLSPPVSVTSQQQRTFRTTISNRGSTPSAFRFLQPKRKLYDTRRVMSEDTLSVPYDRDQLSRSNGSVEKSVIEEDVIPALPSVKALAKAFQGTSQDSNVQLNKPKSYSWKSVDAKTQEESKETVQPSTLQEVPKAITEETVSPATLEEAPKAPTEDSPASPKPSPDSYSPSYENKYIPAESPVQPPILNGSCSELVDKERTPEADTVTEHITEPASSPQKVEEPVIMSQQITEPPKEVVEEPTTPQEPCKDSYSPPYDQKYNPAEGSATETVEKPSDDQAKVENSLEWKEDENVEIVSTPKDEPQQVTPPNTPSDMEKTDEDAKAVIAPTSLLLETTEEVKVEPVHTSQEESVPVRESSDVEKFIESERKASLPPVDSAPQTEVADQLESKPAAETEPESPLAPTVPEVTSATIPAAEEPTPAPEPTPVAEPTPAEEPTPAAEPSPAATEPVTTSISVEETPAPSSPAPETTTTSEETKAPTSSLNGQESTTDASVTSNSSAEETKPAENGYHHEQRPGSPFREDAQSELPRPNTVEQKRAEIKFTQEMPARDRPISPVLVPGKLKSTLAFFENLNKKS